MRDVVPGKQHSGESCSSLGRVHLEGIAVVWRLTQLITTAMFSYLHAFAAARPVSTAGKERHISTHRPEHAAACCALASVLAGCKSERELRAPACLSIRECFCRRSGSRDMPAGAMDKVLIYLSYTGSVQASRLLRKRPARLQLRNDRPLGVRVAFLQARAGYGSPGKM